MCRLTSAICNSRQVWNEDRCKCEYRELANKGTCDKGYIWNPSNCECECDKSCGIGQYLDYKSCMSRNRVVDRLIEECTNVIDENKIYDETLSITSLNTNSSDDCACCTLYVVLFAVFLTASVVIGGVFVYFYWYSKKILFKSI